MTFSDSDLLEFLRARPEKRKKGEGDFVFEFAPPATPLAAEAARALALDFGVWGEISAKNSI